MGYVPNPYLARLFKDPNGTPITAHLTDALI